MVSRDEDDDDVDDDDDIFADTIEAAESMSAVETAPGVRESCFAACCRS